MTITVLVLTNDFTTAQKLCDALSREGNGERMQARYCTLDDTAEQLARSCPDVLILDASVLDPAFRATPNVPRLPEATRVLVHCALPNAAALRSVIEWGACGCVHPDDPNSMKARAVRGVTRGDIWFSRAALLEAVRLRTKIFVNLTGAPDPSQEPGNALTPREQQVLDLIGTGLSNKEIGRQLAISDKTVKTHLHRVYVKLRQSGRVKLLLAQQRDQIGNVAQFVDFLQASTYEPHEHLALLRSLQSSDAASGRQPASASTESLDGLP